MSEKIERAEAWPSSSSTAAAAGTGRRRGTVRTDIGIEEDVKISIHRQVTEFMSSQDECMEFSALLTKQQRAYVHQYVQNLGLLSRSHGKKQTRQLMLYKRITATTIHQNSESVLNEDSRRIIEALMQSPAPNRSGVADNKWQSPPHGAGSSGGASHSGGGGLGARNLNKKFIPPKSRGSHKMMQERAVLPIFSHRDEIVAAIEREQVIVINGDTGSGKTTQVPQYIMEQAHLNRAPCRIICTQPRRIAAVTIAERVTQERSERLGTTTGYQIRLENCFEFNTNLIYTTSGCMIRALMADVAQTFHGLTHIIIDEIHERDKNTDFLLITLRDHIAINKNFKVILMSATMDIDLLSGYFNKCPVINVPGRCYETRTFFLEHILFYTKYKTDQMDRILRNISGQVAVAERTDDGIKSAVDDTTRKFVDDLIVSCCDQTINTSEYFDQLIYLIEGEGVPVDVRHTVNRRTPLIAAAITNNFEYLQQLLSMKASDSIVDCAGRSALFYAEAHPDKVCFDYLYRRQTITNEQEMERLLFSYQQQFNDDEEIDHNLLLNLLITINRADHHGSILVFLPGYNDMITQKEMIERELQSGTYRLFLMHSNMNTQDQRTALKQFAERKIILATNIAETSITFPDVAYVVDTGKVKQNTYDSITGSSYLKSIGISKACALQRAGRAGRTQTGICYRLYSSAKFEAMEKFAMAEFLRIPLTEICLYAKAINRDTSIGSYLSKALQPPSSVSIMNAVQKLTMIGALDGDENITILGKRLVDMPLEVQLGKSLLCAILLRCVDPVLTIVAYHSVKDPFILPSDRMERGRVSRKRKELCEDFFSDHLGIIKLYQKWRQSRELRTEGPFLADHYLSKASLEMMFAVRQQILEHIKRSSLPDGLTVKSLNSNSKDWNLIRACLTSGLYPNIGYIDRAKRKIISRLEKTIVFHPTSVLREATVKDAKVTFDQYPSNWVIFNEKSRVGYLAQIKHNTLIPSINIALFCGRLDAVRNDAIAAVTAATITNPTGVATITNPTPDAPVVFPICGIGANSNDDDDDDNLIVVNDDGDRVHTNSAQYQMPQFQVDDWIVFNVSAEEQTMLVQLKERFGQVFMQFLRCGRRWRPEQYASFVTALKNILANADRESFGTIKSPFEDNYLPRRYDTMMNIGHFQYEPKKKPFRRI